MNAVNEIRSMPTPNCGSTNRAPRNDNGMPRLTQSASRKRRKEREHADHEQQAAACVAQHGREPVAQELRLVLPGDEFDAVRQRARRARGVVVHGGRDVERPLVADAEHAKQFRRLAVEADFALALLETVDDARHVAEPQFAAVLAHDHGELGVLECRLRLAAGAQ